LQDEAEGGGGVSVGAGADVIDLELRTLGGRGDRDEAVVLGQDRLQLVQVLSYLLAALLSLLGHHRLVGVGDVEEALEVLGRFNRLVQVSVGERDP
jgi:hypothetical protein